MLLAGSAMAQVAVNPVAENQWNRYLAKHPEVQAGMMNDPHYLAKHPGIADWLHKHPEVAAYQRQQEQTGGWDTHNHYHDRNWWQKNDPDWVHTHHPDWAANNPNYGHPGAVNNPNYGHPGYDHDGDYDEHHNWHDRKWWIAKNHPWVEKHHPNWFKEQ
jgi:hypothetical protein